MNINTVNNSYNTTKPLDNDNSNIIKVLQKQIMALKDQIQSINQSKLDVKSKRERTTQLEDQIQLIEAQIQQIQMDKIKEKTEKEQRENNNSSDNSTNQGDINISSMTNLVKADSTLKQAKSVRSTKDSLTGAKKVLESEISLDAGRTGGETKGKSKELAKINQRISSLDIAYGDKLKKALNQSDKNDNMDDKVKGKSSQAEDNSEGVETTKDHKEKDNQHKIVDVRI